MENKFSEFIKSIFMTEEIKPEEVVEVAPVADEVIEEPTVAEVAEAVEAVAEVVVEEVKQEYMTRDDVQELVSGVVEQTLANIQLAADASKEAKKLADERIAELRLSIEAIQLELNTPSKKAEKVIPPVKEVKAGTSFSMAAEVKKNRNK